MEAFFDCDLFVKRYRVSVFIFWIISMVYDPCVIGMSPLELAVPHGAFYYWKNVRGGGGYTWIQRRINIINPFTP